MRLIRIKPNYFRGFGGSDWISLDSQLVVLSAPNGFGKTSLTEALEWLLYGQTMRRKRGEELSQRDYQGSYRNAHAPTTEVSYVESEIVLNDGNHHQIKRELRIGSRNIETSHTFVDGTPGDFASLGLTNVELYYPIVAQHTLQDFIHSKPKDRRDKISAAFGLEPLVHYKTVVDKARQRIQTSPPGNIDAARRELSQMTRAMGFNPLVAALRQRWQNEEINVEVDANELHVATLSFLNTQEGNSETLTLALNEKRSEAAQKVFDVAPIQMPSGFQVAIQHLTMQEAQVKATVETLVRGLANFANSVASIYSQAKLQFWQLGLQLTEVDDPELCPMCEENTLGSAKRAQLQQRISQSTDYTTTLDLLKQQCRIVSEFIHNVEQDARAVFPTFLADAQRVRLEALFHETPDLCSTFLSMHDTAKATCTECQRLLEYHANQTSNLHALAINTETLPQARSLVESLSEDLINMIIGVRSTAENYRTAFSSFKQELEGRISSAVAIKEIDAILTPITGWRNIDVLQLYHKMLQQSLTLVRQIETHIQSKQTESFGTKGQEINRWYDILNPNSDVRYKRMEPGTDSLQLIGETFGVEVNFTSYMSECQLNCLGLSVHFMRARTSGTPFSFLWMDDPVQSMDDEHCQALVVEVIQELLTTHRIQLIITTHVQGLADSIWETYYHLQPLRLRISEYLQSGPVIEDAETLGLALRRARTLSAGNEDSRRLAVKVVRRCVELLIRALCIHTHSASPPSTANASNMLPYFSACLGTTTQQTQGLQQTIVFSNPAPHTQVGYTVPTSTNITPHISRIDQYATTLGVM